MLLLLGTTLGRPWFLIPGFRLLIPGFRFLIPGSITRVGRWLIIRVRRWLISVRISIRVIRIRVGRAIRIRVGIWISVRITIRIVRIGVTKSIPPREPKTPPVTVIMESIMSMVPATAEASVTMTPTTTKAMSPAAAEASMSMPPSAEASMSGKSRACEYAKNQKKSY